MTPAWKRGSRRGASARRARDPTARNAESKGCEHADGREGGYSRRRSATPIAWSGSGVLRSGEARRRAQAGVRHLPRLPALLQSVRQLSAPVRPDRRVCRPASWTRSTPSKDFKPVVDACTLCDMCFMTKCPYVPPHEFDLDFPHLMLRYRAVEQRQEGQARLSPAADHRDRPQRPLASRITSGARQLGEPTAGNGLTRGPLHGSGRSASTVTRSCRKLPRQDVHRRARQAKGAPTVDNEAPGGRGRKAVLYATCFVQLQQPRHRPRRHSRDLAKNGVETEVVYPRRAAACRSSSMATSTRVAGSRRATFADRAAATGIEQAAMTSSRLVPSCALDAEVRMAADLARRCRSVKRLSQATYGYLRVRRRHCQARTAWRPGLEALDRAEWRCT